MTAKDEAKKPGWYGLAMGIISLALAIVGYFDTRAKAEQAEDLRVQSDTAIVEKLSNRVEELEDEVRDLHIAVGIMQGVPAEMPIFEPWMDVWPEDDKAEEKSAEIRPLEGVKLTPPEELFAPKPRKKESGEAKRELNALIQQRAY